MGAIKIEVRGTQNHRFTQDEFAERFQASFAVALPNALGRPRTERAQIVVT